MVFTGQLGDAGLAKEVTRGTFVAPSRFVNFEPPFDFSYDITLLESKGISGIPDDVTKTAQGPAQLKGGKIKFEVEPENCGEHHMAAFGVDAVTEVASFIVSTGVNDTIDWTTFTFSVAAGTYVAGQTQADAGSLCALIYTGMHAADGTVTGVSFSRAVNEFTITFSGATTIKWHTGANTAKSIGPLIGFSTAADSTGASTYTGVAVIAAFSHAFSRLASAQLPSYSWWQKNGIDYPTFSGCQLSKLEIDIKAKEFVVASADWVGLSYAAGVSETTTYSAHNAFKFDQAVITVAGSPVVDYEEVKIVIDNAVENVHTVGNGINATKNYSKYFKVSLSMTLTVENTTEWAKFVAGTLSSVTITINSTEKVKGAIPFSLTYTMTNIAYKSAPRPVAKDLIKMTLAAEATSSINSSTTLTATLVNSIGSAY